MPKTIPVILILGLILTVLSAGTAFAWPDMPPDKAVISGPGIEGEVQITDSKVLAVLRLGGLEDMKWGAIKEPKVVGDGFKIIRYFEGGEFRMGDLTYYPHGAGARSVVYFDDGAMKNGDHSPFHAKWLYTTANETVLIDYLTQLNADLPDPAASDGATSATHDVLPKEIRAGVPVTLGFTLQENHKIARVTLYRDGEAERIVLAASASQGPGHYFFNHTFTGAGIWNWSVGAFSGEIDVPMPPLVVVADEQAPQAAAEPQAKPEPQTQARVEPAVKTQPQTAPQSVQAPTRPFTEPTTIGLAALAAVLGILGIGAVLVMQRSKK